MKTLSIVRVGLCVLLLLAFVCAHAWGAKETGVIKGVVLDEKGDTVKDASVTVHDLDPPNGVVEVQTGVEPSVDTNDQGQFVFPSLALGHRYKVYAKKEDDGYPNMELGLYNPKDEALVATAERDNQALDVKVRLGPKAAVLEWNVRDSVTGSPVNPQDVSIHRVDTGGGLSTSAPSKFSYLIPADADLVIEVSAKGYQTWYHPSYTVKGAETPLRAAPSENRKLEIALVRQSKR